MAEKKSVITKKGKEELIKRLEELTTVIKPAVLEELNLARSQGDLSENADYSAAKERSREIDEEITKIRYTLDHSTLVEEETTSNSGKKICRLGGEKITIETIKAKDVKQFTRSFIIVGEIEANPSEGKISNTCPIAQAVLGHGEGDIVEIEANIPYKAKITHIG